ncbi:quinone oxidoreductase family protein [Niveibacterium microcysteis]|uniref:Quinone oxidoreductase n=1 Tax=Niveibacterium microcysteis TaxID=2811415 RepID=A0ABX7M8D3_9RHOO|nr:quinone oxidoreductase [Niveibacterium microcysteis]QSI78005.1 quinone oxidoreductase [Niveibacterium microcysteis]
MSMAIRIPRHGGPEVLEWQAVDVAPPAAGEAQVRHHAVGLNYIDVYHRNGLYPLTLPSGIGVEGAGEVVAVGPGVVDVAVGDRVAYAGGPVGAYAQVRNLPADRLVRLPDAISFETGAAMMLQGLTAQYLLRRTYRVQAGDTILVHAAAGGVGLILCQWAKALGATVIGTVGSDEKAALAQAHGCDHAIIYTRERFADQVKAITGGAGVAVVYDSIGKDTFMDSLACLRPLGTMVTYGNATGPVPPLDLGLLAKMGSLYVTRPTLFTYTAKRSDLLAMSAELFEVVQNGTVKIEIRQRYPLSDAAQAHRDLEARRTTGSTILLP